MKIHSIFKSINGEVNINHQGSICTFIRLSGCNLRCKTCDTIYAQKSDSGKEMSIDEIIAIVDEMNCRSITITGGEPLEQEEELYQLVVALSDKDYIVSIETNGSKLINSQWPVSWVMDYKPKSSGMNHRMLPENYDYLINYDYLKIVVADKDDFDEAVDIIRKHEIEDPIIAFSPMFIDNKPMVDIQDLLKWIEDEKLASNRIIVVNIQIHKLLNID